MGLARLEGVAVLQALVERVAHFELSAPPVRRINNLIRSFASLPTAVYPNVTEHQWNKIGTQ
jgi:hypothetical protein